MQYIVMATCLKKLVLAIIIMLALSFILVATSEIASALPSAVIRIKPDGTVEGSDKIQQNGNVYTLTGNLESSVGKNEAFIFIEKDGVTFDGAGYSITGSGHGTAIYMLRMKNVAIKNFNIQEFETGINFWTVQNWPADSKYTGLPSASKNQILNNKISTVGNVFENSVREIGWCIYLSDATYSNISGNTFTSLDHKGGVYLDTSTSYTNLLKNTFVGCGIYALDSNQTSAQDNIVDGTPLVFFDGFSNQVIDEAGQVYLFHCNNIVLDNVRPTYDYGRTIQLVETTNSEILNCRGYVSLVNSSKNTIHDSLLRSIDLYGSSYNRVFANKIAYSSVCIKLSKSSNFNEIYSNLLSDTRMSLEADKIHKTGLNTAGVQLGDPDQGGCQFNKIHDNTISQHDVGLECYISSNNTITANSISNCKAGIQLGCSNQNNITQNNVTSCYYGVSIYAASSGNLFYHNNFFDNQLQCYETHEATLLSPIDSHSTNNSWDNGKEGNYWSNYNGTDTNGDGIADQAYAVFEKMTDNYPLIKPYSYSPSNGGNIFIPIDQDPTVAHPTALPSGNQPSTEEGFPTYLVVTLVVLAALVITIGLYLKKRMF